MITAQSLSDNFTNQISSLRNSRFAKVYIGSYTGLFVSHPGSSSHCEKSDYDPRMRPWYIAGTTGIKNTIFFFNINNKITRAK